MKTWISGLTATMVVVCAAAGAASFDADESRDAVVTFEYVGQVVNGSPVATSSRQFGNLSAVAGADGSSAYTFYTEATTVSTVANGPLRIVNRTGTTTVYLAAAAGSFDDPDSFRAGTAVQVSSLRQQVIVDTSTGLFTVFNVNTVTWSRDSWPGTGAGGLAEKGQRFRSTLTGRLNSPGGSPTGWFSGYALR
jgi:hypothetical protein